MRTLNVTLTSNENASLSPEGNQNGNGINNTSLTPSSPKAKYPFPYSGGIFSEAARRRKTAMATKVIESIIATEKSFNLAY